MIIEIGHFALILALVFALAQSIVPLVGASRRYADWMAAGGTIAVTQFALISLAFVTLTHAFLTSDFSVRLVATHSHTAKPTLYKFAGTWGNHEGSMLLLVLVLTFFGALVAAFGHNLPATLKARVLSVQGMLCVAFIGFILFTSNPFARLDPAPLQGNDLNPLLQDPALAFHPPFLYLGYVGLSITFSFAMAALIEGRVDNAWARWVRPWALTAWIFLTIGIALGSYWAYYELGWGGWWAWDPVENASFMPWLVAAALLHSAIVVEKRDALKSWTVLLAILAFTFSLLGTFLVRSGVITSVHSFASDPTRGVAILVILGVFVGGALTLFALRAPTMTPGGQFRTVSREGALVLNNLILSVAAATVLLGTLQPLFAEVFWGKEGSLGAPFYDNTFGPLMMILLLAMPVGAMLAWKRADLDKSLRRLWFAAAIGLTVWVWAAMRHDPGPMGALGPLRQAMAWAAPPLGLGLAAWCVVGALVEFTGRLRLFRIPLRESGRRLVGLPRAAWGMLLAHMGVGVLSFAAIAVSIWDFEEAYARAPGQMIEARGHVLRLESVEENVAGPNYETTIATFSLMEGDAVKAVIRPERRFYPVQRMQTTEAGIYAGIWEDVYVILARQQPDGAWGIKVILKPLANWLWIGVLMMVCGGLLSLTDRRMRVGAPAARRREAKA